MIVPYFQEILDNYVAFQLCTQDFVRGGVQQIQLRTEDRQNRDLQAVAP